MARMEAIGSSAAAGQTFPLEIIDLILEDVDPNLSSDNRALLRICSLVSSLFREAGQRRLFKSPRVIFSWVHNSHYSRLRNTLLSNKRLSDFVHELRFTTLPSYQSSLPQPHPISPFPQLGNLHHLRVTGPETKTTPWSELPKIFQDDLLMIFSLPTLQYVDTCNITQFPLNTFYNHPLSKLSLLTHYDSTPEGLPTPSLALSFVTISSLAKLTDTKPPTLTFALPVSHISALRTLIYHADPNTRTIESLFFNVVLNTAKNLVVLEILGHATRNTETKLSLDLTHWLGLIGIHDWDIQRGAPWQRIDEALKQSPSVNLIIHFDRLGPWHGQSAALPFFSQVMPCALENGQLSVIMPEA
ncbi:hypothetical protein DXG01_003141 [Tephrocybe rancida]|nr:hypothetical protein DXG01_003141 [Tephrocybe rancida]